MSLKAADLGMKTKLEEVYPNVVFGPAERTFEISADTNVTIVLSNDEQSKSQDQVLVQNGTTKGEAIESIPYEYRGEQPSRQNNLVVKFPLIAFDRISNSYAEEGNDNYAIKVRGSFITDEKVREKSFGVDIVYQIDVISDRRYEVDEIWRELTMFFHKNNGVEITYESNGQVSSQIYDLLVLDTEPGGDVSTFFNNGIIWRQTIRVLVRNVRMLFARSVPIIEEIPVRVIDFKEE